jgi:cell division initiation protein
VSRVDPPLGWARPTSITGMEMSAKTIREVTFGEKRRGYNPEDVDRFLEEMAVGVDALQQRLREASEPAQRAERDEGEGDAAVQRTLLLAQRAADLLLKESQEQANEIVAGAEEKAAALLADAEQRVGDVEDRALVDARAELAELESSRARAQAQVDALIGWAEEYRSRLCSTLSDALAAVDRTAIHEPVPTSAPTEASGDLADPSGQGAEPGTDEGVAGGDSTSPADEGEPGAPSPVDSTGSAHSEEPTTAAESMAPSPPGLPPTPDQLPSAPTGTWSVMDAPGPPPPPPLPPNSKFGPVTTTTLGAGGLGASGAVAGDGERNLLTDPDEEAIDHFFDTDASDAHQAGGRLRRRR